MTFILNLLFLVLLAMILLVLTGIYLQPSFPIPGVMLIIIGFTFPLLGLAAIAISDS